MVMDNESYFLMKCNYLPIKGGYYANKKAGPTSAPEKVRFAGKSKFPNRMMVLIAISERGASEPFFCMTCQSINYEIYCSDGIQGTLAPFVDQYHADGSVHFCPDLLHATIQKVTESFEGAENTNNPKGLQSPMLSPSSSY